MESFREDPETVATDVVDIVMNWVENHISVEDKLMAKHLLQFSGEAPKSES
jgi:hemerythrin